jgi:hypothetical protein
VEWRGNTWYLSKEGYMWSPELYDFKISEYPLWKIAESLNRYSNIGRVALDGVFPAVFSIEELKRFDDIFRVQSWYANADSISFGRRAGEFVLKLSLNLRGKRIILVVNGEENKLREIEMLLGQILSQIASEGREIFIDMSYPDKVVVSRAHEGSLK